MYSNLKTEITNQYYRLPRLQKLVKYGSASIPWCIVRLHGFLLGALVNFQLNGVPKWIFCLIFKIHMHHMKHHVHLGICSKTHRVLPTVWWGLLNVRELYCSLTTHWSNVRTIANELLIQRQLVYCKPICTYFYHN